MSHPLFHWHLEVSSKCTLKCSRCPRTEKPELFKVTEMDLNFVKSFLTPDILSKTSRILLCGGQGDPIYCKEMLEIVEYIKSHNEKLHLCIVTNGSYKTSEWWERLGNAIGVHDTIVFSIDGWDQESNDKYRTNSNFKSIINAISVLKEVSPELLIIWSTIIFKFNQHKLDEIKQLAKETGADVFNVVQSFLFGSWEPDYIDKELGYDPLEPDMSHEMVSRYRHSERDLFINLSGKQTEFRDIENIRNMTSQFENNKDSYKDKPVLPLCMLGERGLYVDAEGILYPCSWISHPFRTRTSKERDKKIKWNDSLFVKHKKEFDLHTNNLDTILKGNSWTKLTKSWKDPKTMFVECEDKCSYGSAYDKFTRRIIPELDRNKKIEESLKKYRQKAITHIQ